MAFLRCVKKSLIPDPKTLAVNRTNFPSLAVSLSGGFGAEVYENGWYVHSSNVYGQVNTGSFDCSGYSKLKYYFSDGSWGEVGGTWYVAITINGVTSRVNVSRSAGSYTFDLNGAKTIENARFGLDNGNGNCWLSNRFTQIEFIP